MTGSPHEKPDLNELFGRLCNEALDLDARQKLEDELLSNPEAQELYVRYADMHVALRQYAESCDSEEFILREAQAALDAAQQACVTDRAGCDVPADEPVSRVESSMSGTQLPGSLGQYWERLTAPRSRPAVAFAIAAGLLVTAVSAVFYLTTGESQQLAKQESTIVAPQGEELGPAHLAGAVAARWAGAELELIEGTQFAADQRLELVEGLAEVCFLSGARIILQGPAILQIEDENNATVSVGRLAATVPEDAPEFTLHTEVATISCSAAEYGVDIDVDESLLAQVYSGNVELKLSNSESPTPRVELAGNQGLQIDAASGRLRQLDEANRLHFVRYLPKREVLINLADIVAGGNGLADRSREGYHNGISVSDGSSASAYGAPATGDGRYHKAKEFDFIDGVFIPDGAHETVQVDSIGRTFAEFPATMNECWGGVIMARRPAFERSLPFMRLEFHGDNYGYVNWLHIASRPEELSPLGLGLIGMHSNCGITFDLHAIRARYPSKKIVRFRSLVGNLEGKQEAYVADAWVLVDGKLRYSRKAFSREDGVEEIDVPLTDRDRFLVLAVTDAGKDTAYDWVAFGDPVIETTMDTGGVASDFTTHDGSRPVAWRDSETSVTSHDRPDTSRTSLSRSASVSVEHLFRPPLTIAPVTPRPSGLETSTVCRVGSRHQSDDEPLTRKRLEQDQL